MNRLMQKLLESRGIYMAPAGADGAEGGSGGAPDGAGETGGQENGNQGQGDKGNSDEGDKGGEDDGEGDSDGDPATVKKADDKAKSDEGKSGDGKPTDREATLLKDTMKWKDKTRELEASLKAIQDQLGDVDPATARKLASDAKERERADLEKKGEYERIVKQMRDENAKLLEGKDTELSETSKALAAAQKQIDNLTVGAQFRSSEFIAKQSTLPPTIAQKEFAEHFEFEDGQMVPYDKPKGESDRTKMVDANGNPKTFEAAIAELFNKHPDAKSLIRTTVKPGAGSKNQSDLKDSGSKDTKVRGLGKIEQGLKDKKTSQ
jgi:hypothetical protein